MLKEFEFWLVPFDWRVGGVGLQRSYDNDSGNLDIFTSRLNLSISEISDSIISISILVRSTVQ